MAGGICIFAEHYNQTLDASVSELSTAAHMIRETTGEKIQVLLIGNQSKALVDQIKKLDVDEIYIVDTNTDQLFLDDVNSSVAATLIRRIAPSSVLIPATPVGRSIFSRTAAQLGCGLTADCTELKADIREDGSWYIKQNKPSFGENVFVTIVTKVGITPQMMTIRPGVYQPFLETYREDTKVIYCEEISCPDSGIEVLECKPAVSEVDSILSAERVVVGGRGVEETESVELLKAFAGKIGAALGGTRPLADTGVIPFASQIGQTGLTIRPKICISMGVSGAIQHTEGIKDSKLFIAVNQDESAPIFGLADYGYIGDAREVMKSFLEE